MNMKASTLFQSKPADRPLLAPKGKSEVRSLSVLMKYVGTGGLRTIGRRYLEPDLLGKATLGPAFVSAASSHLHNTDAKVGRLSRFNCLRL